MRAFWGLFVLAASACGPKLSQEECHELLDKYTEKVIDQGKPSLSQGERIEMKQQARRLSELDPEFAKCSDEVSRSEFECAMQANNADEIERCLM